MLSKRYEPTEVTVELHKSGYFKTLKHESSSS